jgi:hypothetical protein
MVSRVKELDPYIRQVVAPLGIMFPFPFYCRLLDTYMKSSASITATVAQSGGRTGEERVKGWLVGGQVMKGLRGGLQEGGMMEVLLWPVKWVHW